jgi:arsenite-transporting ATPase
MIRSSIENMNFDIIIFDTAPTGHTLRFLTFPPIFEMGLNKILALKNKFKKVMGSMSKLFGSKEQLNRALDKIFAKMQKLRNASHAVN